MVTAELYLMKFWSENFSEVLTWKLHVSNSADVGQWFVSGPSNLACERRM